MFYDLRKNFNYFRLNRSLAPILNTPPAAAVKSGAYTAVSQVCKRDVLLYLLAAKSLFRYAQPRRIVVLNDGSLDASDQELIAAHLPGCEFVSIASIDPSPCPKRGCWERLHLVVELSKTDYVIQLDSDTITLKEPTALIEYVKDGISFAQGTLDGTQVLSMEEHCKMLRQIAKPDSHVQVVAEANFPKLKRYRELKYIRGCAGFSGFARGGVDKSLMIELNNELQTLIGIQKWNEWGSEQVMSNLLVANAPRAAVLPYPSYGAFHRARDIHGSVFLHFMGPDRFYRNKYGTLGHKVIAELNNTL